LFRVALLPIFLWLYWTQPPEWALGCFLVAAISDVLDGLFARMLNQRTKLGGVLDPIADKLLIFAALLVLVIDHRLPLWLLLINAFRDGLMVVGALMVIWKNLEIPTQPSRVGKYATFALICLVALSLADRSVYAPGSLRAYTAVMAFLAAFCVVVSTLQYFARYGHLWVAPRRPRAPRAMQERVGG
jgi:cardiolipin synthase